MNNNMQQQSKKTISVPSEAVITVSVQGQMTQLKLADEHKFQDWIVQAAGHFIKSGTSFTAYAVTLALREDVQNIHGSKGYYIPHSTAEAQKYGYTFGVQDVMHYSLMNHPKINAQWDIALDWTTYNQMPAREYVCSPLVPLKQMDKEYHLDDMTNDTAQAVPKNDGAQTHILPASMQSFYVPPKNAADDTADGNTPTIPWMDYEDNS